MPESAEICEMCPKRHRNGTCLINGCWIAPRHPVCDYGRRMIHNAHEAECPPKDFCQNKTENNKMKTKMIKAVFAEANAAVSKVVLKDGLSPFSRVLLDVAGSNVSLTGSSGYMQLTWRMEGETVGDGAATLPGARLAAFAAAMPEGTVELVKTANDRVTLTGGDVSYKVASGEASEYAMMAGPKAGTAKMEIPSATLREMLRKVKFAMATDATRPALCGVNVKIDGNRLEMTATDGRTLAHVEKEVLSNGASFDITLPAKTVGVLWWLLDKETEELDIQSDGRTVRIMGAKWCLTAKVIDQKYSDWRRVVPGNPTHKATIARSVFLDALGRASLAMDNDGGVKIGFDEGRITFAAKSEFANADISMKECKIEAKEKEKHTFHFNPKLLKDALESIDDDEFTLGYGWGGASGPVLIKCSLPWMAVVMPMQVK